MRTDTGKFAVLPPRQNLRPRYRQLLLGVAFSLAPLSILAQPPGPSQAAHKRTAIPASDARLAWRAFLAAGDLDDAMALARKMLAAHPDSLPWHRRLASAAEQNGKADTAAQAYAWLVIHGHQYNLMKKAINLATGAQQNDAVARLMQVRSTHEPFNAEHWRELIAAQLNVGHFEHVLALLQQADRAHPRAFFLQQQADVLAEMGEPERQAMLLRRKIRRYGPDVFTNLQLATLQYVHGHLRQALTTLKQALGTAPAHAAAYWHTLSSLAWMLQDLPASGHASAILVRAGTAQVEDYQRLYLLHEEHAPGVAYAYALIGWRQTRAVPLFFDALAAADTLHGSALSQNVFASVRTQDRPLLQTRADYWTQWAQVAYSEGRNRLARVRYREALRRSPQDATVIAGYLWLLVDTQDTRALEILADRWSARRTHDPQIRAALATALALIDRPGRALALLRPYLPRHRHDPTWLVQYAGLLDQADQGDAARALDLQAARALPKHEALPAPDAATATQQRTERLNLAQTLTPDDPAREAMRRMVRSGDKTSGDPILGWTLAQNSPEATRLWLQRHDKKTPAPAWARLNQALATDDATATMQLLTDAAEKLPRRDRVNAAHTLGWNPLAVSLAYHGLQGEPDDRNLERQFQELAIAQANALGGDVEWQRSSGLESIDSTATARHWLDSDWSLAGRVSSRRQIRDDAAQLGRPAATARDAQITLTQQLPRGERGVTLGGGRNTAGYLHLGVFDRYRISRWLQVAVAADAGARADDSVPLAIAGLADQLDASASYQWTAWDSVNATANVARLRAQGGGDLGGRQRLNVEYRHQIWLAPPQVALIASATAARYRHADHVPASVRRLVPAGQSPQTRFFVPRSYAQACVGVGLNEGYRDDWTSRSHLFGTASACSNSESGVGAIVAGGMSTPILGPDHFTMSLGYSNNAGATSNRSLTANLGYQYDFTP